MIERDDGRKLDLTAHVSNSRGLPEIISPFPERVRPMPVLFEIKDGKYQGQNVKINVGVDTYNRLRNSPGNQITLSVMVDKEGNLHQNYTEGDTCHVAIRELIRS